MSEKQPNPSAIRAELEAALAHAKEAGLAAIAEFAASAPLSADGHIADSSGWAFVRIRHPTYHFREALKSIQPKSKALHGEWTVLGFGREVGVAASQSITAHERGCEAARAVLKHYFPEQDFFVASRLD